MDTEPAHSVSKRGRVGEGRPTLYTPELANRLADHIAAGLTGEEAAALEDISCDCISRWRKSNHEFCEAIKKAEAQRLRRRLERIEAGDTGWQGTAWALERIYPHRFARPEVMNQIAVVANAQNTRGGELIIDKEMLKRISERRKEVMKQLKDDVREEMQTGGAGE
jgi:hypothetical protein